MSENEDGQPRRAFSSPDDAPDDTPAHEPISPRRGADAEPLNPFARPGSADAERPVPSDVERPSPALPDDEAAQREIAGLTGGASGTGEALPRRSAASGMTPPEQGMIPAPAATGTPPGGTGGSWLDHHRRTVVSWIVGGLVAAILVGIAVFAVTRDRATTADESPSPTAPVSSAPPEVGTDDLMTVEDAALIVPGGTWAVTDTADNKADANWRAICLSGTDGDVNALNTLQRTFGTSDEDQLAAIQQVDVFANEEVATNIQAARVAGLAACSEVPVQIVSSVGIEGLADETMQLTVAAQDDPTKYHTLLLARTGPALTVVDVARNDSPVSAQEATAGLVPSLERVCQVVDGTCPGEPTFSPALPPPVDPVGWLITSDFPRITPGAGLWTSTAPAALSAKGMGCENITLASEPGPTERQQRTYLLTQDDRVPSAFGVDELRFVTGSNEDASAFSSKLAGNIASCKDRVLTASVKELEAVTGTGAYGAALSARLFEVQQATSTNESVLYQVVVATAGVRSGYLLATVTPEFKFSDDQLKTLALRMAQRLSQGQ